MGPGRLRVGSRFSENFGFGRPWRLFLFIAFSTSPSGVIGGAHIGYNLQINQWVAGVEGSIDGTTINKTFSTPLAGATWHPGAYTRFNSRSRWCRLGPRLDLCDRRCRLHGHHERLFADFGIGLPFSIENISKTRAGWTVGGGIEYAVTNNWSVRAEYRYSDFGHYTDFPFVPPARPVFPGSSPAFQHHLTENQVQVGVSYKFDLSLAPALVARY